jgi:glycerol-3-phosphate acyltransferase PlsY
LSVTNEKSDVLHNAAELIDRLLEAKAPIEYGNSVKNTPSAPVARRYACAEQPLDLGDATQSNTSMPDIPVLINTAMVIAAYLCGSIASAIIVCRLMGLEDPRGGGSGNPGATNVLRLHGKTAAALTLVGDVLKGFLPVVAAVWLGLPHIVVALTGLAAFGGHLYPVFFGFRGGKGVATLIGVLFGTWWMLGVLFVLTWALTAAISRYSSLSALTSAALVPFYTWLVLPEGAYIACFSLMAALLFWRHRSNIRNLLAGTEDKLGE